MLLFWKIRLAVARRRLIWPLQLCGRAWFGLGLLGLGLVLGAQESGPKALQESTQASPGKVRFAYQHYNGQKYHIVAQVDEQVLRNRKLLYNTRILNRIAVQVAQMRGANALLAVNYQISEEAENGRFFSWAAETSARFEVSPQGLYQNLPPNETMPSLRNVPSFPPRALQIGEGWNAPGTEVHDLNQIFSIPAHLRFDFTVDYMYRGETVYEGRKVERILLFYTISEDVTKQLPQQYKWFSRQNSNGAQLDVPRSVRASHNIELYWDSQRGLPVFQKEDFEVAYLLQSGDEIVFRGRSRGKVTVAEPMRRKDLSQKLEQDLRSAGIAADVRQNDKGISISLDSINFYPDSDRMLPGEPRKLQRISQILQKYPNRDILVTGHTADLGRPAQQLELSQKRAAAIGQFFIENRVRKREQIVIRGAGGTEPIAPNSTEQGRKQNRRVEITLLEN